MHTQTLMKTKKLNSGPPKNLSLHSVEVNYDAVQMHIWMQAD